MEKIDRVEKVEKIAKFYSMGNHSLWQAEPGNLIRKCWKFERFRKFEKLEKAGKGGGEGGGKGGGRPTLIYEVSIPDSMFWVSTHTTVCL